MTTSITVQVFDMQDLRLALPDLVWEQHHPGSLIPVEAGVYVWIRSDEVVLYIGSAMGKLGLRGRISTHLRLRANADALDLPGKRAEYKAVIAGLSEHQARLLYARCSNAPDIEGMLLAYSVVLTGTTPMLNGGGWDWTPRTREANSRALLVLRQKNARESA